MNIAKRIFSLLLVLCMLFTSGVVEAIAVTVQSQEEEQQSQSNTIPLIDVSDMFVVSEEPEPTQENENTDTTEATETAPMVSVLTETKSTVKGESQNFSYEVLESGGCCITGCGLKQDEAAHEPGAEATATTAQTCTICGYEIAPAQGVPETESTTAETAPAGTNASEKGGFPWWIILAVVAIGGAAAFVLIKKRK